VTTPRTPTKKPTARSGAAARKVAAKSPATKKPVAARATATKASVTKKSVPTKTRAAAKTRVSTKVPVKKAAAAKKQVVVPRQRDVAPEPVAPKPRLRRPLVVLAKRHDGRPVSFSERVEERMHRELKHVGPVCHRCRLNGSRLATLAAAG
jgi:hypothetical protein